MLESENTMNSSTDIPELNDSKGTSTLNIPSASELANSLVENQRNDTAPVEQKHDTSLVEQKHDTTLAVISTQSQIIEKAFTDLTSEQKNTAKVKFIFDQPLTAENNRILLEKGYSIRQKMFYDSTADKDCDHNGKYQVTLVPNHLAGQEMHRQFASLQRQMDDFANLLWQPMSINPWHRSRSHRSYFPSLWF
jgi:hypothetical protein